MRKAQLTILLFGLAGASACASAQAKGSDKPPLDVPPPPPHEVQLPAEPLEPVGEIPNPTAPPSGTARPGGRTSREAPKPAAGDAKPDAKPDQPSAPPPTTPETPAAAPPPSPAPAPQLKTPQTDTSEAARSVRMTIDRAHGTLMTVNYAPLSNERKQAYNDVKLSLQQAEDALKEGNIVFAQAMASKAEKLARELAGK